MGTVPTDKHTEIETQYTTPIQSHFWGPGDVGTAATDIHTEIGTQYTTTHTLSFLEAWGRGDSTQGYTYGGRDTIYHPYTLSSLETWGRGDSTQGYTYGDRDTIYHSHTLSFLEIWGRGDSTQGYTYGDRDTIYHPYTLSFLETWGRGDSTQGYTYGYRDTIYHPYTLSFLETWGRGDSTQGYRYGYRDIIYHPYTLSLLETWGHGDSTYHYNGCFNKHDDVLMQACLTVGFFGFMRCGESTVNNSYDDKVNLGIEDITLLDNRFIIHLKSSKNDPFRQGRDIIVFATDNEMCPMSALRSYLDKLKDLSNKSGALFINSQGLPRSASFPSLDLKFLWHIISIYQIN